jgi:adenylate cyclase
VRRDAGRVRISAQLIEAESANHVWAERYDRDLSDIFAVQDEIASAVTLAIDPAISLAEQRRIARKPPESLDAWEAYQLGLWHGARGNAGDLAQERIFLERAIRLDPGFAAAYAELAWVHHAEGVVYGKYSVPETSALITTVAGEALRRDPNNAEAHAAIAIMYGSMGDPVSQDFHNEQALAIDPNSVRARRGVAARLLFNGEPAAARTVLLELLRVNPLDETAAANRAQVAISHFFEGDYAMAASAAREAIAAHPGHPWSYRWLAASLGHLGRQDEAGPVLRQAIGISPESFRFYVSERPPWFRPGDYAAMLDGLRKAGWMG